MEDRHDIAALHSAFLTRELRPSEHLDQRLEAVEARNPEINAIVTLTEDLAREAAASSDERYAAGAPLGPLDGMTVGVKDIIQTSGVPTTFGSPLFKENVPVEDALCVQRLKAAGCMMVGKTNTSEFAAGANTVNELFGATRNPFDPALTSGGSTGGGACAKRKVKGSDLDDMMLKGLKKKHGIS